MAIRIINYIQKNEYPATFLIILAVLFTFFLITGTLLSANHFIDEYQVFSIHETIKERGFWATIVHQLKLLDFLSRIRFRPLFIVHTVIESQIFGDNSFLWSIYTGLIIALSVFFLFIFGKLIQFSFQEALLFSSMTILGPQLEIGYRLFMNETIGFFWLSVALVFLMLSLNSSQNKKRVYEILFVISVFLMSLSKESFIILIPAIVLIRVWQSSQLKQQTWLESIRKDITVNSLLILLLIAELLFIFFFIGTNKGYAGLEATNTFGLARAAIVLTFYGFSPAIVPGSIIAFFVCKRETNRSSISLLLDLLRSPICILFFLIIIPQVLLHAKSGIGSRYLIPGILGFSFLLIYLYRYLKSKSGFSRRLITFLVIFSLTFNTVLAYNNAYSYTLERHNFTSFLNFVEANTVPEDKILVVANLLTHYEWSFAVKAYLDLLLHRKNVYLMTYEGRQTDALSTTSKTQENVGLSHNLDLVKKYYNHQTIQKLESPETIRCIIIFPNLKQDFARVAYWFNPSNYVEQSFNESNPVDLFSAGFIKLRDWVASGLSRLRRTEDFYVYIRREPEER